MIRIRFDGMANGKLIHDLDMDQIAKWYHEDGLSLRQIGRLTGADFKTVERRMRAVGIPRRPPGHTGPVPRGERNRKPARITPEEAAEIQAAFDADPYFTFDEGAERFGRANSTIRSVVGTGRKPWGRQLAEDAHEILGLYNQGLRGAEIDDVLGWRRGRATVVQQALGLPAERPLPDAGILDSLYEREGSYTKVAAQLKVAPSRVRDALAAAGVEIGGRWHPPPPGSTPGTKAYDIRQVLSRHPGGLSTRRLVQLVWHLPTARNPELAWCGSILRTLEERGYVTRAGSEPGSYNNVPSTVWRPSEPELEVNGSPNMCVART
jgi:hypothetical protein